MFSFRSTDNKRLIVEQFERVRR